MNSTTAESDFLGGVLHGRRPQIAEEERLEALCRLREWSELTRAVYPGVQSMSIADFQRNLIRDFVREALGLLQYLRGPIKELAFWTLRRFQVENAKVLVRAVVNRIPFEDVMSQLLPLPPSLAVESSRLANGSTLEESIAGLPFGISQDWMRRMATRFGPQSRIFFLETAMDYGYALGLIYRVKVVPADQRELVEPLVRQEVNIFQLMLTLRGRFHYGLQANQLLPLHIQASGISAQQLNTMLQDGDALSVASCVRGTILDDLPPTEGITAPPALNFSRLEQLAWQRFLRLAHRAFRRSHMDPGALLGYLGIRRVEIANLITISEALRMGLSAEVANSRLIRSPAN